MPGLIDSHVHLAMGFIGLGDFTGELPSYTAIRSTAAAKQLLDQGVTTVRDMGGETFSLKRAIDEGIIPGPRIYPSGGFISQTSGHGDFRQRNTPNPNMEDGGSKWWRNQTHIVDGPDRVRSAARENLRLGASQLKLAIGGGVASPSDPLDTTQFSFEEISAAVAAAENWGTYVSVHGYTTRSVNIALDAGVKVVEHGHLLDRATVERIADEGVWLSFQPFTQCSFDNYTPAQNQKMALVCQGTAQIYEWIAELPELKVVHGTDVVLDPTRGLLGMTEHMTRLEEWLEPHEILRMATGNAGELLKLSGQRNPYPLADLGVVKEGAYADLLLVEGNPLEDLEAVTDPDRLLLIMKDGKVHKDAGARGSP